MSEQMFLQLPADVFLTVFGEIWRFVTSGQIGGVPTIVTMLLPFILGVVTGFLVKKMLKIGIMIGVVVVIVSYFGLFNLSLSSLKNAVITYGPVVAHYATLVIGMLPLGVGFIIGVIIGFLI